MRKECQLVVKIKDIRLPDAPAPTRAYKETPEWERKLYESSLRRTEPPKRRNYSRWTDKEINLMKKMWLEGYIAKDIAPHVGGNIRATQNKLTWLISKDQIPQRNTLNDEIKKGIKKDHKNGMVVSDICRKYLVSRGTVHNITK